jgi:hypothetical protein
MFTNVSRRGRFRDRRTDGYREIGLKAPQRCNANDDKCTIDAELSH